MRARALFGLAVTSAALGLLLSAAMTTPASGEGAKRVPSAPSARSAPSAPPVGEAEKRYDPENLTGISQATEAWVRGTERFQAKDYPAAIDLYRKSIQLNPRSPLAPYLMGEAHLAANNVSEAEASFKQAEELSDSKNPALRAQVLFSVADVYERQKKWAQAKAAWQTYAEHAAKYVDAGAHPQSAASRLEAIEAVLALEPQTALVRARIAAEKAEKADAGAKAPLPKK